MCWVQHLELPSNGGFCIRQVGNSSRSWHTGQLAGSPGKKQCSEPAACLSWSGVLSALQDALASFERAAEIAPQRLIHRVELGRCHDRLGNRSQALKELEVCCCSTAAVFTGNKCTAPRCLTASTPSHTTTSLQTISCYDGAAAILKPVQHLLLCSLQIAICVRPDKINAATSESLCHATLIWVAGCHGHGGRGHQLLSAAA